MVEKAQQQRAKRRAEIKLMGLQEIRDEERGVIDIISRITSYNVCYTKLLRENKGVLVEFLNTAGFLATPAKTLFNRLLIYPFILLKSAFFTNSQDTFAPKLNIVVCFDSYNFV